VGRNIGINGFQLTKQAKTGTNMEIEAVIILSIAGVYNMYFTAERAVQNYYIKCAGELYEPKSVDDILLTQANFSQQASVYLQSFFENTPLFSSSAELLQQVKSCFEAVHEFANFARQTLVADTAENRAAFNSKSTAIFSLIETRLGQYRREQEL
jgi:hypothetical protein